MDGNRYALSVQFSAVSASGTWRWLSRPRIRTNRLWPWDWARLSWASSMMREVAVTELLLLKEMRGTFTCDTWGYDSYMVIQNENILITISESTDDKNSHGENTNRAIQEFAGMLATSFQELDELDANSRVIQEIRSLGGDGRDLHGLDLSHVDLSNASLSSADLRQSDLTASDLSGALLTFVDFRGAILKDANLQGANLVQAKFEDADLENADLSEARLHAAIIDGVDLSTVTLESALYNQLTTWPDGFDPEAAGAIYDGF
jgi:hypothetical protein